MSDYPAAWKRVPTPIAAVFGLQLPYRPPKNALAAFLWRRRIWLETTIGLSVLEPWEKLLILAIFYLLFTLVLTGLFKFVPEKAPLLYRRGVYYLLGAEEHRRAAHLVAEWAGRNTSIGQL